ncbi:hypothetical protein DXT99_16455 [Pontibacter diazotrophicus]|uniref:STAS/SEC14 domain-containing protein n=1 Tax=Pontibacter diazotrophicus TaxID=1400979 RepID=A0A3D8L9X3_9BACT|nr:hypothetical protein [Pontibacter diazotrophicus]RDV14178.1 hypothetical protein DXT99_16455 [Pontibacter diazotrophicus]
MVLFDTEYIHLEYYAAHHVLVSQWYGGCSSLQYREAVTITSQYIRELHIPFAISDRRLLPPLPREDIQWTAQDFLPEFCQLPLKRFAAINSFDEVAAEQLVHFLNSKQYPLPFEAQVFEDLTSAYEWLLSVEA